MKLPERLILALPFISNYVSGFSRLSKSLLFLLAFTLIASTIHIFTFGSYTVKYPGRSEIIEESPKRDERELWFSPKGILFVVEFSGDTIRLKSWRNSKAGWFNSKNIAIEIEEYAESALKLPSRSGVRIKDPLIYNFSRDGSRIALSLLGNIHVLSLEDFSARKLGLVIPVSAQGVVKSIAFLGREQNLVSVVYDNGQFSLFNTETGKKSTLGTWLEGPWPLTSYGPMVLASSFTTGNTFCITTEGETGRPFIQTPYIGPDIGTCISALNCEDIAIGTRDGRVIRIIGKGINARRLNYSIHPDLQVRALSSNKDHGIFVGGESQWIYLIDSHEEAKEFLKANPTITALASNKSHLAYYNKSLVVVPIEEDWKTNSSGDKVFLFAGFITGFIGIVVPVLQTRKKKPV